MARPTTQYLNGYMSTKCVSSSKRLLRCVPKAYVGITGLRGHPIRQDKRTINGGMTIMAYHGMTNKKMAHRRKSETVAFRVW